MSRLLTVLVVLMSGFQPSEAADPVADLQARIDSRTVELAFDERWGYLPSLLDAFDIPRSSQLLVFSKTSAQFRLISPRRPRAIYFNDDVYVGWVQRAPVLEISAVDPGRGAVFYTLRQIEDDRPRFIADNGTCLQCHESGRTSGIPGHLTRSVFPDADGLPHFGLGMINVDQTTPIAQRWGGWFISGYPDIPHRGNAVGSEDQVDAFEAGELRREPTEFFDPDEYLTKHSDPVAHLVLAHQTQAHNAIAKAGHEARAALAYTTQMTRIFGRPSEELLASLKRRIEGPSEQLVKQLLMQGEAPLPAPIESPSGFADEFQQRGGPLRQLHLVRRLFRYPCSFLIESDDFAALPEQVKSYVGKRFEEHFSQKQNGARSKADAAACLAAVAAVTD